MAQYHRFANAGPQLTSMGPPAITFRSLSADLAALRGLAPPGVAASTASVGEALVALGATAPGPTSEQGRDLLCLRLGKNPAMPVLVTGCHHAREWISLEVPFLLADFLVRSYAGNGQVQRLVDSLDLWFVPLVNPDGHEESVLNDRLWRANNPTAVGRPAVDLNRNYATRHWDITVGSFSDSPGEDQFRGPRAGFAREVEAMQSLVRRVGFKACLDFHSRGRWVLFPWAGRSEAPPDARQERVARHFERVADLKGEDYEALQASRLYPEVAFRVTGVRPPADEGRVPGSLLDFVVEQSPGAIALTIELDPDFDDPRGHVLDESEIQPVFDRVRGAALTFLNCVRTLTDPPPPRPVVLDEATDRDHPFYCADPSLAFENA